MEDVNGRTRKDRIRAVMEELGADEETAAFAVALEDGRATGSPRAITFPLPEEEARRHVRFLSEQHFFSRDEAERYITGDRSMMDAVAERCAEYWRRVDAGLESPADWDKRRAAADAAVAAR